MPTVHFQLLPYHLYTIITMLLLFVYNKSLRYRGLAERKMIHSCSSALDALTTRNPMLT